MPYGVFEVKVGGSGGDPVFIEELQESGAIVKADKFSKFLTGGAIHNPAAINMLPWWADDALFQPLFEKRRIPRNSPNMASDMTAPLLSNVVELVDDDKLLAAEGGIISPSPSTTTCSSSSSSNFGAFEKNVQPPQQSLKYDAFRRRFWNRNGKEHNQHKHIAPRAVARVEPKSFFANERTFIKWISAGLLIMGIAHLFFLTAQDQADQSALNVGNWMMYSALIICV